jgi:hypothetical protein
MKTPLIIEKPDNPRSIPDDALQVNLSIWPTQQQKLLLNAILLKGNDCLEAWYAWKPNLEYGIDLSSFRFLPMLYHNLQQQGIIDPMLNRLKGVYRKTWVENQLLFQRVAHAMCQIKAAGIPMVLLKGAPLSILYFKNPGLRPMNDVDVLIPLVQREKAIHLLQSLGWSPRLNPPLRLTQAYLNVKHAHNFNDADGFGIDLHWHVLTNGLAHDDDDDFWQAALPLVFNEVDCLALNPTDMLFHLISHGMRWDVDLPLRWITDAMIVLREKGQQINWNRLVSHAKRHRTTLKTFNALDYLKGNFNAPIPLEILTVLKEIPASWKEHTEERISSYRNPLLGYFPEYWIAFMHFQGRDGYSGPLGFLRFVQAQKGFETLKEAFRWSVWRIYIRITHLMRGRLEYRIQKKIK